jgi:hypothetical protein
MKRKKVFNFNKEMKKLAKYEKIIKNGGYV